MDKTQVWDAALNQMSGKISRMEFHTWFKKIRVSEISGTAIVLACPTEMNKNWLESKYHGVILSNLKSVLPEIDRLYFRVELGLADTPVGKKDTPAVFAEPKAPRKLPNSPDARIEPGLETRITQPKFTLKNFIVGEENRFVHAACKSIVDTKPTEKKKYNPFFIYGGCGLGKTHLLQGIANELRGKYPNAKILYITSERFMNEIIDAIKNRKADELRKKYRRVDAFLLDDVQFFEGKEKTQEELFNTFNDLFEFNKQIVFSADRPPSELTGISDRLKSRMGWGLLADLQMPKFETRLAIVQAKAQERQLILPPDVQDFIATNVRNNLREVENILNQIAAEGDISGISPTVQTMGKMLRKINPDRSMEITGMGSLARSTDEVITIVSEYFQIPATELLGISRKKEIVFPRQIAWLLCKDVLKMSYEAIGADFGGKNHTTIMHGVRKIKDLARKDSPTARHIHALKKDLGIK
ncbi:chromosomal replication initiator protein DnaA [bacterium]|jgi:chromosomal replication initiator protein|nr:chromosomal replication initiator protein DnaA [bacterium]MBT6832300.1 chromosomal replication initiator protein DnaA [bacterium]MBT6996031.1 chromosomal replication initiator protein DnaA [bacterium]MBT7772316.1 chromosomal replication initiator protein DnaA [bacterium]